MQYQAPYKKQFKTWNQPASRSTEIKKAMEYKDKAIKSYTDAKEISIIITSSLRDAVQMVIAFPDKKLREEKWKEIEEEYEKFKITYTECLSNARHEGIVRPILNKMAIKPKPEPLDDTEIHPTTEDGDNVFNPNQIN